MTKSRSITEVSPSVPGISFNREKTAFTFSHNDLPASDHFFRANDAHIKVEFGELNILFGQVSAFEDNEFYKAAVEISLPIELASIFLVETIFHQPSLDGEHPFSRALQEYLQHSKLTERQVKAPLKLPVSHEMYRAFSANYASTALSKGQGMIEFFEANPSMIANLSQRNAVRRDDGLKPVIAIILPPDLLNNLFNKVKSTLDEYKVEIGGQNAMES